MGKCNSVTMSRGALALFEPGSDASLVEGELGAELAAGENRLKESRCQSCGGYVFVGEGADDMTEAGPSSAARLVTRCRELGRT